MTAQGRGRPAKPTAHPVGGHMRRRRVELGLTVRDVALAAGLRISSASYISQLESGAKAPHEALARRLAEALRDDPRIYLAWAALGKRSDPVQTARAVGVLSELLRHPALSSPGREPSPLSRSGEAQERTAAESAASLARPATQPLPVGSRSLEPLERAKPPGQPIAPTPPLFETRALARPSPTAQVLVPELEEGADPGEAARAVPRVIATHAIAAEPPVAEVLARPFAYRLSEAGVRRVRDALPAGRVVVLTRRTWPLEPSAPYAVRLSGHVLLSRILWNERQLLLLPAPGESDFIVLEAPDRSALEHLLAGRVCGLLGGLA